MTDERARQRPSDKVLRQAELNVADVIGGLMEFWGFKRPMGRTWTALYLSAEPLSAAELGERLTMSAGGISMTLAELTKWGAVKKTWRPGDRRDYFECETSVWKLVTRVMRERELAMIHDAAEAFAAADELMAERLRERELDAATATRLRFIRKRLGTLRGLASLGSRLVNALVLGERFDPGLLRDAPAARGAR